VTLSTFRRSVASPSSASISPSKKIVLEEFTATQLKYQHREAGNRARRFASAEAVEEEPVSKNYFSSRHGVTSTGTPETLVSWLAEGMQATRGLQSMSMAIRCRPE